MAPTIDDSIDAQTHTSTIINDDVGLFAFSSALKNIAFGSFAGIVSEVIEYPFDLAKVRLQAQILSPTSGSTQLRFNGPIDCLKQTFMEEGFRGLYRGLPAPIVGSMAETAVLFVAYSGFQDIIRASTSRPRAEKLSIPELGVAAAGAGFVGSFIITPIELVKCKMQVQMMNMPPTQRHHTSRRLLFPSSPIRGLFALPTFSATPIAVPKTSPSSPHRLSSTSTAVKLPPGLIGIIRDTMQAHGVRGLWIGHTGTLLRETGGTAAWFAVKELVADVLLKRRKARDAAVDAPSAYSQELVAEPSRLSTSTVGAETGTELMPWESAIAGAAAGVACVLALYPADTVKSAMQTEDELRPRGSGFLSKQAKASKTFTGTLARLWAAHGLKGLYAGCGMTVARAVPSSGIVFVVYDGLAAWLG